MSLLDRAGSFVTEYPMAVQFAEAQEDVFWTAREIAMEKDMQSLHTEMTEQELHGVITVLKLFTMYELEVGENYWGGYIMKHFPRYEVQRMASMFAMMELSVHSPFYRKINELLNLDTNEFYNSYTEDDVLRNRIEWIERQFKTDDPLLAVAIGSITEGAILYSNFAFLKHFQAQGKNKLNNMVAGINFSVRDENLHSLAGAWLYRTLLEELREGADRGLESNTELSRRIRNVEEQIIHTCEQVFEHESRIIDMIFEKGDIRGITEYQMKQFIKSRLNLCLEQLGMEKYYTVDYNPISDWFYRNINSGILHDFFHRQGNSYSRDWNETKFTWASK